MRAKGAMMNGKTIETQKKQEDADVETAPCDAFLEIKPGIFIAVLAGAFLFMCRIGVFSGVNGTILCATGALALLAAGGCLLRNYSRRQQLMSEEDARMMSVYGDRIKEYCRVLGQIDFGSCQKEYGLTSTQSRRLLAGLEKNGTLKSYGGRKSAVYKLTDWKNIPIN